MKATRLFQNINVVYKAVYFKFVGNFSTKRVSELHIIFPGLS